jgi:hypothetical protein
VSRVVVAASHLGRACDMNPWSERWTARHRRLSSPADTIRPTVWSCLSGAVAVLSVVYLAIVVGVRFVDRCGRSVPITPGKGVDVAAVYASECASDVELAALRGRVWHGGGAGGGCRAGRLAEWLVSLSLLVGTAFSGRPR